MSLANATQITSNTFDVPPIGTATHHEGRDITRTMNPILGYLLLIGGILIMLMSGVQVYRVFTKQVTPFRLFDFEGIKLNIAQMTPKLATTPEMIRLQKQLNIDLTQVTQQATEPVEIFPAVMVNTIADLAAFTMLMGFMLNMGAKFASIGVKLIRPIYIKA